MVPTEETCAECSQPYSKGDVDDSNLCDECKGRLVEKIRNTKPEEMILGASDAAIRGMMDARRAGRPTDFTVTAASLRESGEDYFCIAWETVSAGFGELTFYRQDGKLRAETEGMSARFCREVLAKFLEQVLPKEERNSQRKTEKPRPYGHYEGHDLSRADMPVIWSIGATPRGAIEALCKARWNGTLEKLGDPLTDGDPDYTWGYRFTSDNGTSFKAAGIHIPGGVALTWWK